MMRQETGRIGAPAWLALAMLFAVLAGCETTDDARVLQVLNQRGFGRPTEDANRQYYVGIGDSLVIDDPVHAEYRGQTETVRMDGVITLADVGEVYVNGLSPDEVTAVVRQKYGAIVNNTDGIRTRIVGMNSKRYYISGISPYRPVSVPFKGDELLIDAMIHSSFTSVLVDTTDILVIRGDPENPLVIRCNFDDITQKGITRDNIQIRENDILYLTPSIVGYITAAVSVITAPLTPIIKLFYGYNNVIAVESSFGQGTVGLGTHNTFGGGF